MKLRSAFLATMNTPDQEPEKKKVKAEKKKMSASASYKLLLAACLLSLIVSTLASFFFYTKWSESEDKRSLLLVEKNVMTQNYSILKTSFDNLFNELALMRDENAKVFTLQAADSTKHHLVRVYWNPYTRKTFIDAISLPAADSVSEYRLWCSYGGQITDAGTFETATDVDMQPMKSIVNADTWAVTLGPKGNSTIPSFDHAFLIERK
jgi:hypothetical protein